jgi:hypothetical protein
VAERPFALPPAQQRELAMVNESHARGLLGFERAFEERGKIARTIVENISSMNETTTQTRALIAESQQLIATLDRLLRWR